jgi:hypothetical protein
MIELQKALDFLLLQHNKLILESCNNIEILIKINYNCLCPYKTYSINKRFLFNINDCINIFIIKKDHFKKYDDKILLFLNNNKVLLNNIKIGLLVKNNYTDDKSITINDIELFISNYIQYKCSDKIDKYNIYNFTNNIKINKLPKDVIKVNYPLNNIIFNLFQITVLNINNIDCIQGLIYFGIIKNGDKFIIQYNPIKRYTISINIINNNKYLFKFNNKLYNNDELCKQIQSLLPKCNILNYLIMLKNGYSYEKLNRYYDKQKCKFQNEIQYHIFNKFGNFCNKISMNIKSKIINIGLSKSKIKTVNNIFEIITEYVKKFGLIPAFEINETVNRAV